MYLPRALSVPGTVTNPQMAFSASCEILYGVFSTFSEVLDTRLFLGVDAAAFSKSVGSTLFGSGTLSEVGKRGEEEKADRVPFPQISCN